MGEHRIYVKGLSEKVTEEDLKELFRECGTIKSIKTGSSDFAFVEFENSADAEEAVKSFNGHEYNSKMLQVEIAQTKLSENDFPEERDRTHSPRSPLPDNWDDGNNWTNDSYSPQSGYRAYDRDFDKSCYNCGCFGHFARNCTARPRNPKYIDTRGTKAPLYRDSNRDPRNAPYYRPSTYTTDYRDSRDFIKRPERQWPSDIRVDLRDEINGRLPDPYISHRTRGDYIDDYPPYIDRRYDGYQNYKDYDSSRYSPRGAGRPRDMSPESHYYHRGADLRDNGNYDELRDRSYYRRRDIEPRSRGGFSGDDFGRRPDSAYGTRQTDLREFSTRMGYHDRESRHQR